MFKLYIIKNLFFFVFDQSYKTRYIYKRKIIWLSHYSAVVDKQACKLRPTDQGTYFFGFEIGLMMLTTGFRITFGFAFFLLLLIGLMILFTGFFTTLDKILGKVVDFVVGLKLSVVGVVFLVGPLVLWFFPPFNGLMILFTGFFTTLGKLLGKVVGFVVCLKLLVVGVVFLVGPLVRWILPPLNGLMILFTGFFTTLGELLGKIVVALVVCLKLLVVAVVFVVFLVGILVGPLVVGAVNVVFLVVKVGLFVVLQSLPATLLSNSQSEGDATC